LKVISTFLSEVKIEIHHCNDDSFMSKVKSTSMTVWEFHGMEDGGDQVTQLTLFSSINIFQLMKKYHCTVSCLSLGYSNIGSSICILYLFGEAFSRLGGGLSSFGFGGTNAHGVVSCATEADGRDEGLILWMQVV